MHRYFCRAIHSLNICENKWYHQLGAQVDIQNMILTQWRTQKISEGGPSFVTIVWRHKSTLGEVPKARPF